MPYAKNSYSLWEYTVLAESGKFFCEDGNFTPHHRERAKKQIHAQNIVETSDFNETKLFELPRMRTIVLYMFNVDSITSKLKRS